MKKNSLLIVLLALSIIAIFYLQNRLSTAIPQQAVTTSTARSSPPSDSSPCVPTFVDGGGPYYKPSVPYREHLAPPDATGDMLTVSGKIMSSDCSTSIPGAVLDIWQANPEGKYEDSWYRGKVTADREGKYTFSTMIPKGYGEGTGYRPPHIHFKVFVDNREIITSQMFFPEAKGKPGFEEAYIMELKEETRGGNKTHSGIHDIVLP